MLRLFNPIRTRGNDMKLLLAGAAMLVALASPAVARTTTPATSPSTQSVYRTVATTEILNSDGSASELTVTTVYYIFGYE